MHTIIPSSKLVGRSTPHVVFHKRFHTASSRLLPPFRSSRSHFLQLGLFHIKQQPALLVARPWNFDPIHELAVDKLQALNAHFPVTDDPNPIDTVIQVSDAKSCTCTVFGLPQVFLGAQNDGLSGEEMIDCLAKVDVFALLKPIREINNFADIEIAGSTVAGHANDEDEVVLGKFWGMNDWRRLFWLWFGVDRIGPLESHGSSHLPDVYRGGYRIEGRHIRLRHCRFRSK